MIIKYDFWQVHLSGPQSHLLNSNEKIGISWKVSIIQNSFEPLYYEQDRLMLMIFIICNSSIERSSLIFGVGDGFFMSNSKSMTFLVWYPIMNNNLVN